MIGSNIRVTKGSMFGTWNQRAKKSIALLVMVLDAEYF